MLTLALLSACATETQDAPDGTDPDGGSGGSAGSNAGGNDTTGGTGGKAGTSGGSGGTTGGGNTATAGGGGDGPSTGGTGGSGGSSGGGGSGGAATGGGGATAGGSSGSGGMGGAGGAGGAGGKGGGGAGGTGGGAGGSGGKAGSGGGGTGGGGGKACATGKLTIMTASADGVEGALTPNLAHDGNPGTRWSSEPGQPHWIWFDLGQPAHISRVQILWEAAYGIDYIIQRSAASGGPWTDMLHVTNGNGGTDNLTDLTAGEGRYVRMYGNTHNLTYGFSMFEFEIYGDLDENCQ